MKKTALIAGLWVAASCVAWAIVPPRNMADTAAYRQKCREMMRTEALQMPEREATATERTARTFPRVPVIMVNYPDMAYRVTRANVDSMFNGENFTLYNATGSVRKYFYDQSLGQYNPQFDIYGPVTVSHGYTYYSNNAGILVLEACALMNDSLDFTQYDTDNDGYVDLLYALYAGPPASDGVCIASSWIPNASQSLIWPHYGTIDTYGTGGKPRVFDGKTVNAYEVSSELDGCFSNQTTTTMAGVGLACHEFGHGLGLPDLYTTDNSPHKTCGQWDIMDYGCYNNDVRTPPSYSAYERWFMGWQVPRLITQPENVSLTALSDGGETLLISPTGTHNMNGEIPSPTDFYLLENRRKSGWDTFLPGKGLLVTHIRYNSSSWSYNTVNNNPNAMGVDIVEADGLQPTAGHDGFHGKAGDLYPAGATSFTECPAYSVNNITLNNGVIRFSFMNGTPTNDPINSSLSDDEDTIYTLTGQPVRNTDNLHGVFIVHKNGKTYKITK